MDRFRRLPLLLRIAKTAALLCVLIVLVLLGWMQVTGHPYPPVAVGFQLVLLFALILRSPGAVFDFPLNAYASRWRSASTWQQRARVIALLAALPINNRRAIEWNREGTTLCHGQQYKEAISAYERAIAIAPDAAMPRSLNGKGSALFRLGRYEEALAAHEQALALDASNPGYWYNVRNALARLGRYEEALAAALQAVALAPTNAIYWSGKGSALVGLGRYEEALVAHEQAIALHPTNPYVWHNKGNALERWGHDEEALVAYQQALTLAPKFTIEWNRKIALLKQLGRSAEAQEAERQRDEARGSK